MDPFVTLFPLLAGWLADLALGDPACLPHPVVAFGRTIAFCERHLNRGKHRTMKGAWTVFVLVGCVYLITSVCLNALAAFSTGICLCFSTILVFYCLAGTTLIREVRMTFQAADRSLDEGRHQVSRIVGRDTTELTDQEIRIAALETLAENLSDGVIAPLFWYLLLGVPGMLAYKMVNTLDSMIGYKNDRYRAFGKVAARLDDVANFVPARLTALLMVLASGCPSLLKFVIRYGNQHASPNSGYPEAALAGILDCRFGGPHSYFGEWFYKPYIGTNNRPITSADMLLAIKINRKAEIAMLLIIICLLILV